MSEEKNPNIIFSKFFVKSFRKGILAELILQMPPKEISLPQMLTLEIINEPHDVNVSTIAQEMNITNSSASTLINRLYKKELLDYINDKEDRRVKYLKLSEKGVNVLNIFVKCQNKAADKLTANLSTKEKEDLANIMAKML